MSADDMNGNGMFEQEQRPPKSAAENVVSGRALFVLDADAPIRHKLNDILNKKEVDAFMLACIMLNVVILAVQTPMNTMSAETNANLDIADHILSVIFSIEMIGKSSCRTFPAEVVGLLCTSGQGSLTSRASTGRIIALGFIMEPTSYMRSSWYVLDFVVVFSIWISWGVLLFSGGNGAADSNISYIRTMRALRPLRSLRSFPYVKLIMSSLYDSIPMFVNVSTIIAFVFLIFSAIGLQLFAGATTHRCDANFAVYCMGKPCSSLVPSKSDGNATGESGSWISSTMNVEVEEDWPCIHAGQADDVSKPCVTQTCPKSMLETCALEDNKCNAKRYIGSGDLPDEIDLFGFNDVRAGMMTLFIVATLDEWSQLADPLRQSDVDGASLVWIYYVLVVMFAGMYVTPRPRPSLSDDRPYDDDDDDDDDDDEERCPHYSYYHHHHHHHHHHHAELTGSVYATVASYCNNAPTSTGSLNVTSST